MNGKKSKMIRKAVYYDLATNRKNRKYHLNWHFGIEADSLRQLYQSEKRNYTRHQKGDVTYA